MALHNINYIKINQLQKQNHLQPIRKFSPYFPSVKVLFCTEQQATGFFIYFVFKPLTCFPIPLVHSLMYKNCSIHKTEFLNCEVL